MLTPQDVLTILAGLGLFEALRGHLPLQRSVRRARSGQPDRRDDLPPVTVIRPIKDLDHGLAENLEAALGYDYPAEVQTIFVLDDDRDPAYPLVAMAAERARARGQDAIVLECGEPPSGVTGKLHAMQAGLDVAKHGIVAFADSDTRPGPTLLRDLVTPLVDDPSVGSTFAPVVVDQPLVTPSDAGYALMLNGLYSPAARKEAGADGRLPFIMGQFMAFRRLTLEVIGGLEGTKGELVDDMNIGLRMHAQGYHNVMVETPMSIVQGELSLREFDGVYRRWIAFSRRGLPLEFKLPLQLRATLWWVLLLLGLAGFAGGAPLAGALGLLGVLVTGLSINRLHAEVGGQPLGWRLGWVVFALLLFSPYVYARVLLGRQVAWRGRVYQLDATAKLAHRAKEALLSGSFPSVEVRP
ncbi:MAG: glycosyltransferase [Myxococcales bacterium]|nr:glycosyltransferase [Myxococcales bacterium]